VVILEHERRIADAFQGAAQFRRTPFADVENGGARFGDRPLCHQRLSRGLRNDRAHVDAFDQMIRGSTGRGVVLWQTFRAHDHGDGPARPTGSSGQLAVTPRS
jgi:hypothetical protein